MTRLPVEFIRIPLAHRAFHDASKGRPENSLGAIRAAIGRGYGIEIDLQLSRDGQAVVFHDYDIGRLTAGKGAVRQHLLAELQQQTLNGSSEGIPSLADALAVVRGRVPLLLELKDQDGMMGPDIGALEAAIARDLQRYSGPIALMSFNPHSVAELASLLPDVARGLVTDSFSAQHWMLLSEEVRENLRDIPDFDRTRASFISHNASDLSRPRVPEIKATGAAVLCWTVRSKQQEVEARKIADNITFEGYDADLIPSADVITIKSGR